MGNTQKLMIAIGGVFVMGYFLVGTNKDQTDNQKKSASMIRDVANMQRIAHKKCPLLIKEHTGTQIASLVFKTDTDKATYLTLEWKGEGNDNFKQAICTISVPYGGVSKLVIDDEVVIDRGRR
jgi:hypothetical protein